jgi:ribosomal subunit interface protein
MIKALQISGVHSQLTDEMRSYVNKKIGGLDNYIPRGARESVHAEVKLKEGKSKDKQKHECEVIMKLPKATITVHKKSTSILAAIDEVEANLKHQLKRYKDTHRSSRFYRHTLARFRRKNGGFKEANLISE